MMFAKLNRLLAVSFLVLFAGAIGAQAKPFLSARLHPNAMMHTAASPTLYTVERAIGTTPAWVPLDVAVDGDGYVFAIDGKTNSVRKLPPSGTAAAISRTFGSEGTGNGQFMQPQRIGVDAMNYVYVLDGRKNTVQKFTRQGIFMRQWPISGDPAGMCVGPDSFIYVLTYEGRIYKFSPSGRQMGEYQHSGNNPRDIALDSSGNIYVLDSEPAIYKYSASGLYLSKMATDYQYVDWFGDGHMAIAGNTIYVGSSATGPGMNAILSFSLTGTPGASYVGFGGGNGQSIGCNGIAVDASGNLYVADLVEARVQKLTSAGVYSRQWGWASTANGQFRGPVSVTADSVGNIYVADAFNQRIQKFDSSGNYVTKWGNAGTGNGQFQMPISITAGYGDAIYVSDMMANRVQKFTSAGVFSSKFGAAGSGNGQFAGPACLDAASNGNVYVVDTGNQRVQYFKAGGAYIGQFGSGLQSGWGVAVTTNQVFVTDNNQCKVLKYGLTGTPAGSFGSEGQGYGQFGNPQAITADSAGKLWVSDTNTGLIQQFTPAGVVQNVVTPASDTYVNAGQPMGVAVSGTKLLISDIVYQQVFVLAPAASPASPAKVAVSSLCAAAAPNGGAQITFSLSASAAVDIEIDNIAGRPVRYVSGGTYNQGLNTALWDGRNSSGAKVPGGTYLVRLTARDGNGQQANSVARLNLHR